jgi:hypothetical protein
MKFKDDNSFDMFGKKYGIYMDLDYLKYIIKDKKERNFVVQEIKRLEKEGQDYTDFFIDYLSKNFSKGIIDTDAYVFFTFKTLKKLRKDIY